MKIGLSICMVVLLAAAFYAGGEYRRSQPVPVDTVTVTHTVQIPSKPSVILKPVLVPYDTVRFLAQIQSLKNRADSLESLLTTYLEPFGGEVFDSLHTSTATLHYRAVGVAFPMDRSISIALDSISLKVPEVTITRTVEEPIPWYEKPVWFLAGIGVGLLATIAK